MLKYVRDIDIKLFKIIHETRVCLPDDLMCRLNQ